MTQVRLLPIVILAVVALLVFKTIGLVTTGSYVLGVTSALAAETKKAAPADGAEADLALPGDPTMTDSAPTVVDEAPTLGQAEGSGGHEPPAAGGEAAVAAEHGAEAAPAEEVPAGEHGAEAEAAPADHAAEPGATPAEGVVCPEPVVLTEGALPAEAAVPHEPAADAPAHDPADPATAAVECDPRAEAVPMEYDPTGKLVPLTAEDGGSLTERALLESLSKRRSELDTYAAELDLRQSIVDAAELKIVERTATLEQLEAQIAALVDQRQAMETSQFAGIVTMYENMKPKDAAAILNDLDMSVLLQVAKAMAPRKMAPILAAMSATRAQELTVQMAAGTSEADQQMKPEDLAALPQIVGQ